MTDRDRTLTLLTHWQERYTALDRTWTDFEKVVGTGDSRLFDSVWNGFDGYTESLSLALGDWQNWLAWYSNENDWGKKKLPAGFDKKLKPIKNLSDLYKLVAESRKRA